MAEAPGAADPPREAAPPFDPTGSRLTQTEAVLLFGAPRRALNLLAFGWANRVDRGFAWLEVAPPEGGADEESLAPLLPPERRLDVRDARDLVPDRAASNLALLTLLRPESPSDDLARLTDFLTLPLPIQDLVSRLRQNALPGAIVISNVDRLGSGPDVSPGEVMRILEVLKRERLTLFVTSAGAAPPPPAMVQAFDHAYEVSDPGGTGWLEADLKGAGGREGNDVPPERPVPLRRTAVFQEAMESVRLHDLRRSGQLSWRVPLYTARRPPSKAYRTEGGMAPP